MNIFCGILLAIVVVGFIGFFLRDSNLLKKLTEGSRQFLDNRLYGTEIPQEMTVGYREEHGQEYTKVMMKHVRFTIGSGMSSTLRLAGNEMAGRHAVICRKQDGGDLFYQFQNLNKHNPVRIWKPEEERYVAMTKKPIEIKEGRVYAFLIGGYRMQLFLDPKNPGRPSTVFDIPVPKKTTKTYAEAKTVEMAEVSYKAPTSPVSPTPKEHDGFSTDVLL